MSELTSIIPMAGEPAILARRYVGALFDLADKEKVVDAVATDMGSLQQLWTESTEWRFMACDPRLDAEAAMKAVEVVTNSAGMNKLTVKFLSVLAHNRRLSLLPALVAGFLAEVAKRRGEYQAEVRTARSLSAGQKTKLEQALQDVAGGKVHVMITEDPSILGGLTVKLGSQFIDASVKTKLDHLERMLKGAA